SGAIRKHELTRKDKEDDRTRHIVRLRAQTGPVFLAYRDRPEIDALVAAIESTPPLCEVLADGVTHTIWRTTPEDAAKLSRQFEPVPRFSIADGHHRAASASRARRELRDEGAKGTARDTFLAVAFPARQLRILAYNRVVKDLDGRTPRAFLEALGSRCREVTNERIES